MSLAKITLLGMHRWMQESDDNLFGELSLPEGMDATTLVNVIMMHGAEFEVLYANPDVMKSMIGVWSDKWFFTFQRWVRALAIDYNPLENYDRMEDWSDAGSKSRNGSSSESDNRQTADVASRQSAINKVNSENRQTAETKQTDQSGEVSESGNTTLQHQTAESKNTATDSTENTGTQSASQTYNSSEHDSTTEHQVSAYDASTYQPDSKDLMTGDDTTINGSSATTSRGSKTGNDTTTDQSVIAETSGTSDSKSTEDSRNTAECSITAENAGTEETHNETDTDARMLREDGSRSQTDEDHENTAAMHSGRIHGNIGVTTSQQMLQAELDVAKFNLYEEASNLFLTELCIYTY